MSSHLDTVPAWYQDIVEHTANRGLWAQLCANTRKHRKHLSPIEACYREFEAFLVYKL